MVQDRKNMMVYGLFKNELRAEKFVGLNNYMAIVKCKINKHL